jgi:adenylate cyclase
MTAASTPRCRLTYVIRGTREQVVLQGPRVVIGRSSRCDLTLADDSISRNHAELILGPDGWTLRDLDSRNGIEVNGRRLSQRALRDGDQLKIGSVAMQCEITGGPAAAPDVVIDDTKTEPPPRAVIEMDTMLPLLAQIAPAPERPPESEKGAKPRPPPLESEASKQLRKRLGVAAPLRQAAEALLGATDLPSLLERFLTIVATHLRAQRGFVGLKDEKSGELVAKATWSHKKEQAGPIVISRTIADAAMNAHQSILVGDADDDSRFGAVESIRQMQIRSAMCAPLLRNGQVGGLIYVDTLSLASPFGRDDLEVLSLFATLAAVAVEETALRATIAREQRIRERLARFSSGSVVNHIVEQLKSGDAPGDGAVEVAMRSMEREVSVLFCDFAGFTGFAETLAPSEVTQVLNRAFERLTAAVFAEEGTLDKFTGDGMMVFFGAPLEQPDHALRAVRTAVRMQRALAEPVADGVPLPPLALRIGVNSGPAIVGDIGTPARSDYTAIGATVNTASRLESTVAKPGQIVVGPATYEAVKGRFHCQPLQEQALRGMTRPIQPYLVLGDREAAAEGGSAAARPAPAESSTPDPATPTPIPPK